MGYESMDEDDLDDEEDYDEDVYEDEDDDDYMGLGLSKAKKSRRGGSPGSDVSEDEEGIAAWGTSKKDLYNADQIETEADALEEEAEAKRLQQKHLQAMNEEDFGFDETEWVESDKKEDAEDEAGVVTEVLPQVEITDDMSSEEKLKILKTRYPEFEPLAKDFADLRTKHAELEKAAKAVKAPEDEEAILGPAPAPVIKFRALSAYLGAISMYFMLLSSSQDASGKPCPLPPAQLRAHPVMGSLVKFKKLWETVKDLSVPEPPKEDATKRHESKQHSEAPLSTTKEQVGKNKQEQESEKKKKKKNEKKQSKAQRAAEAAQAEAEARRAEKLRETEANLADLSKLVTEPIKKRKSRKQKSARDAEDSDFGDEDALTAKEAEEKARQKRSLRFYTSQLAQKANKRNAAGRDAGGDADLPYRERLKDRQARLNAEAEKRGKQRPDKMEQLGGDSDEEDHRLAKEIRGEGAGTTMTNITIWSRPAPSRRRTKRRRAQRLMRPQPAKVDAWRSKRRLGQTANVPSPTRSRRIRVLRRSAIRILATPVSRRGRSSKRRRRSSAVSASFIREVKVLVATVVNLLVSRRTWSRVSSYRPRSLLFGYMHYGRSLCSLKYGLACTYIFSLMIYTFQFLTFYFPPAPPSFPRYHQILNKILGIRKQK